jgi:hypothetical protein
MLLFFFLLRRSRCPSCVCILYRSSIARYVNEQRTNIQGKWYVRTLQLHKCVQNENNKPYENAFMLEDER